MTEPARRWTMPWRLVLTLGLLAGGVIISTRLMPTSSEPAPWDVVGPAALTVGAAFLAMTWLHNYFWGVATALLVILHPVYRQWALTDFTGWTWPTPWLVGPLMVWGFWCTLWRGWRDLTRRRVPAPWGLSLFAAGTLFLASTLPTGAVLLSVLAVLLSVYGVADIFRGLAERLILLPPDHQDRAKP
jgi:hypothetical protein